MSQEFDFLSLTVSQATLYLRPFKCLRERVVQLGQVRNASEKAHNGSPEGLRFESPPVQNLIHSIVLIRHEVAVGEDSLLDLLPVVRESSSADGNTDLFVEKVEQGILDTKEAVTLDVDVYVGY
jgi:hypothetical protein